jgi:transposase
LGFADETWWSRFTQPRLRVWSEADRPLHLVEQARQKEDTDPKALACYGVLMRWHGPEAAMQEAVWLRFVDGRPVSAIAIQFLAWCCGKLQQLGVRVWALVWDNASWHRSVKVRGWIRAHNRAVKEEGVGVRILVCRLPVKSPWLNPIEPKWVHGKRRIVEPTRTLSAQEVAERVCAALNCHHEPHLSIPEHVP